MNAKPLLPGYLASLIKEITGLQREVRDEDLLVDDLALTSIDYVEIRGALKDKWSIDLSLSQVSACGRFAELVALASSAQRVSPTNLS